MVLIFILLFTFISPVLAFDIEGSLLSRDGYTSYTINDQSNNWQSVLEFPLDYEILKLNCKVKLGKKIKLINLAYLTNISGEPEKPFIDSDWISTEGVGEADLYAETETKVDMSEFSLDLLLNHDFISSKKMFLGLGLGYKESKHNYMIVGPGYQKNNINNTKIYFDDQEELLEYDLHIKAPYILLYSETSAIKSKIKIYPNLDVYDLDHHILRDKYSESENNGSGFKLDVQYNKEIKKNLALTVGFIYELIKADGKQNQWFEDSDVEYEVDYELEYKHRSFNAGIEYRF